MLCFALARELKCPVHEVESWPFTDILDWCAYFELTKKESK